MDEKKEIPEKDSIKYRNVHDAARIYLLPNFFTAGNMCCGFLSICKCIEAKNAPNIVEANNLYMWAVYFIFGACIFDLFDGRMARIFKRESMFGAEFDSIADTVSFGVAPAFLVYFLIFDPERANSFDWLNNLTASAGPIIGFIYLLCAGIRLAKFNVLTNPLIPGNEKKSPASDFMGIPSPVAAAITASLVLLLTQLNHDQNAVVTSTSLKTWLSVILLPVMLLVSILMVTNIPYPTFKHINWNGKTRALAFISIILLIIIAAKFHIFTIPAVLLVYVFYGMFRALKKKLAKTNSENTEPESVEETF